MSELTKICRDCGKVTTYDKLVKNKVCPGGIDSYCKKCHNKRCKVWRINHKDQNKATQKSYRDRNKMRGYMHWQKRQARIRDLPDNLTLLQWENCKEYFNNKCAYCGKTNKLTADHYIPLSHPKCLGTVIDNIIPSCQSCNSSKWMQEPTLWAYDKFDNNDAQQILQKISLYFLHVRGRADQLGRILCLSVHRDDEVLSCGGILLQHKNFVHTHYFNSVHPLVNQDIYDAEAAAVKKALECSTSYSQYMGVNELDQFSIALFISEIEDVINERKPNTLIIPHPSYNQDHRVIYEAAITASRVHDKNWFVKNVLVAEQPETHTPMRLDCPFIPNLFIPINIKHKLELYALYKSQQRGHRTMDHVRALAEVRGMQCGVPFAEAFMVNRVVY